MTEAIEIITFKLAGHSCADFIAANRPVDAWLRRQPGFRSRRIAQKRDGTIVDMLVWADAQAGTAAAARVGEEVQLSAMHAMIDHRTVAWSLGPNAGESC